MTTLHLMVGLPCSGKTTLARQLAEAHRALRLTPDEWHLPLFGQDLDSPDHDARHDRIEALLWDLAARALMLETNVILDFGFWSRAEREDFRARAARLGAGSIVHFASVPEPELLQRLAARNASGATDVFGIPEDMLRSWIALFEPPDADELRPRFFDGPPGY